MKNQNVLRILALVMTIAMMLSVASCNLFGKPEEETTPSTTTPQTTTPQATTPNETTPDETTPEETTPEETTPDETTPEGGDDPVVPPVECEEHSYEINLVDNAQRFEKTYGVCTVCGFVDDEHTHKIEAGKCVYCDFEFTTSEVVSSFDADGDGAMDVYTFSAALPEKFNDAIRIDAFKDAAAGNHMEYDEIRGNKSPYMPYAHAYCNDGSTNELIYTVTVDKAGIYDVAVHIRLKDQKTRGATFVINKGTENEQSIAATYGWATADEAILVRDSDWLQSAYYTGLSFELQEGENTITIQVATGIEKSQHFRDLYLVWSADLPAAHEHVWGEEVTVITPATCVAGKGTVACECGETKEVEIPAAADAEHSYEINLVDNAQRFEKTYGVCTVCGFVDDEHTHKIEAGKCVYCDFEFTTSEVVSSFDADGDGAMDVYTFSAALPEKFNDAIRIDAFKDAAAGNHMEYDEIRGNKSPYMPYAHAYCNDGSTNELIYTVTVDKAGIYDVAVHIRLKDQKTRGATFVINKGTENEQSIAATYGWATADEAILVRDSDWLQSAYYTGLSFELQEGENTITIQVATGIEKSQHFRDLYLVWSADLPAEETPADPEPEGPQTLTAEEAIALGNTFEKGTYSEELYYVTLTLNTKVNANGFARATLDGVDMIISVAGGYLTGEAENSIAVGDTVTFLAKVGCVNSATTASTKEARLFEIQSWEIIEKAPVAES